MLCEECIQLRALVEILTIKTHRLEDENSSLQSKIRVLEAEVAWAENGYNAKFDAASKP